MKDNVVIIGRPNVGKSTLFNRLIGKRKAIVHHVPGTTRDRNENVVSWRGKEFILADTGGWAMNDQVFSDSVKKQMEIGLRKSDLVIFLVDGKDGIHPLDREIQNILRRTNKKYLLVVNKIDTQKEDLKIYDFCNLGMNDIISISAQHGRGISELLLKIVENLPGKPDEKNLKPVINVILVGKPNVGKSSLVNALSKEERSIVHDRPGTTREAFDNIIPGKDTDFVIIDTPGLHRGRKFKDDMEYLSALSTAHAIDRADVAILVADAEQGIGETEARVAQLIVEKKKGCLIAVNKWDLIEEKEEAAKYFKKSIEDKLKFISWADVIFVSAKTSQRTEKILQKVEEIYKEYSKVIPKEELTEVIRRAQAEKPLSRRGEMLSIRKVEQLDRRPPVFSFGVNNPELVHFSYKRFLENRIRDSFSFTGTPMIIKFHTEKMPD